MKGKKRKKNVKKIHVQSVKMLLVFHSFFPLCNRVVVSLWFIVSQFMFVKVYISVQVQLKCITVNTPNLSFSISFIGEIYTALALWFD